MIPDASTPSDYLEALLRALTAAPDGVLTRDRVQEIATLAVIRGLETAGVARRVRDDSDTERWDALVLLSSAAAERTLYRIGQLEDRTEWWRAVNP